MATVSEITKPKSIEVSLTGLTVGDDLTIFRMPDGAIDIVVEGSGSYLVYFADREVFGMQVVTVRSGHNVFAAQIPTDDGVTLYIASESVAAKAFAEKISTVPIVIGPHPPKREYVPRIANQ
jgi:hypothetical protein